MSPLHTVSSRILSDVKLWFELNFRLGPNGMRWLSGLLLREGSGKFIKCCIFPGCMKTRVVFELFSPLRDIIPFLKH